MPRNPIDGCMCGNGGDGSNCEWNRHGRCEVCGWNEKVYAYRLHLLYTNGLTKLRYGVRGLKIPANDVKNV